MEDTRVNLGKAGHGIYAGVAAFDKLSATFARSVGLADGFLHLLRLRASQINGCAYCDRMHTRDALASGESADRVAVLPAWRETTYFNEKERASLALVEAVTRIGEGQVPDDVYAAAATVLSNDEIAAVEWIAIVINTWNRIAIASRYPVGP